jgi:hypothetical protein
MQPRLKITLLPPAFAASAGRLGPIGQLLLQQPLLPTDPQSLRSVPQPALELLTNMGAIRRLRTMPDVNESRVALKSTDAVTLWKAEVMKQAEGAAASGEGIAPLQGAKAVSWEERIIAIARAATAALMGVIEDARDAASEGSDVVLDTRAAPAPVRATVKERGTAAAAAAAVLAPARVVAAPRASVGLEKGGNDHGRRYSGGDNSYVPDER